MYYLCFPSSCLPHHPPDKHDLIQRLTRASLSLSDIKSLIEDSKNQLLGKLTNEVDRLSQLLTTLIHRIDDLDKKTTQIERSCIESHSRFEREIRELKKSNEENVTELRQEMEQRIHRSGNIIIFGLPEQNEGTADERKSRDSNAVVEIIGEIDVDVAQSTQYLQVHRLGRPRMDKPRPLRVSGFTVGQKAQVLRSAKSLRNRDGYKDIFINPDLTPHQQREANALRAELKQRRGNGENDLVIHSGKIIPRSQLSNFH